MRLQTAVALLFGLLTCSVASAAAPVDGSASDVLAPRLPMQGQNGSFKRAIDIDVPDFRRLGPRLGQGTPHVHDWDRDANGNPVRGPGRPPEPGEIEENN